MEASVLAGDTRGARQDRKHLVDIDAAGGLALIGLVSALLLPSLDAENRHGQPYLWATVHLTVAALMTMLWRRARRMSQPERVAGPTPEDTRRPLPAAPPGPLPPPPLPRRQDVSWPAATGAPGYLPCLRRRFAWEWARPVAVAVPLRVPPSGPEPIRWQGRCGAGGRGRWPLARARGWWHPGFRPELRRGLC
ncbi:hypothetical protein GCM10011374_00180 [Kocuria dechangensis]|uniref:Uncharacterized protein n=1 Tax=Kocuria dechangensis TaxID=1176249 RepID=A0A917GER8_9MICC|nr:hypothetical protein GCM10011374_00180 [Kocuria dechangensis]